METNLAETPESAESAQVETTEVDSEVVETEGAESAPAAAEPGKPESRDKIQERFDKLTREKYEGLSRAERAEYRAQMLEQRLAEIEARTAPKETVAPSDSRPKLEDYDFDTAAHEAALDAYYAKQARESARAALAEERAAAQRQQLETDWQRKQGEFIKSRPEYAEKVGSLPPYLMTPEVAEEIKEAGNPEVALYLAENVDKLAEIARLPQKAIAREIGRIEARLEAKKTAPPPVSKAPPPVTKVNADSAVDEDIPRDDWSDARFRKWREKSLDKQRVRK